MRANDQFDFGPFPTLTTPRLILRELTAGDAADVLVWRGDPEVQKFNDPPLIDLDEAQAFIAAMRTGYDRQKQVMWGITLREQGRVIGDVDLHEWERFHQRAEIGYSLGKAWWGQGIASEALQAVIAFGFQYMQLHRIEALTIADNVRSVRMLERLGFTREGTRREQSLEDDGAFHDSAIYGLLRQEYLP